MSASIAQRPEAQPQLFATVPKERSFVIKVMILAALVRLLVVGLLNISNAITILRLSPDSERYHRVALEINRALAAGVDPWFAWQDHGWFRFTALVYQIAGPYPVVIQLINILCGTLTVYVAWRLAWRTTRSVFVSRLTAVCVAFFPSFIYWSCLMLKDPASILAMTLIVLAVTELRFRFHIGWLLVVAGSLIVYLGVRDYMFLVGGALVIASMCVYLPRSLEAKNSAVITVLVIALGLPTLVGFGPLGLGFVEESQYFDLDYINHVRVSMGNHGSGAIYDHNEVATWSNDPLHNIQTALHGLFYFFLVIDFANIDSTRQLIALPEVLIFVLLLPAFFRGAKVAWERREVMFPLLIFALGVTAVYLSATTNMGALFRWKMQIMPIFMLLISTGLEACSHGRIYRIAAKSVSLFAPLPSAPPRIKPSRPLGYA